MKVRKKLECGRAAAAAWFLVPLLVLVVLKTDSLPQLTRLRETSITPASNLFFSITQTKTADSVADAPPSPASSAGDGVDAIKDLAAPRSKLSCNVTISGMDICAMEGDIRVHGKSATVYVAAASNDSYRPGNGTLRVLPYGRPTDGGTWVTIRSSAPADDDTILPPCTVTHDVPAVVFSTACCYSKNFFHATDDTTIPLYNTVREYDGHVQLLVADYDHALIFKLRHFLAALSIYPVIDFNADNTVRCFPSVRVGLEKTKELGMDPARSSKSYTMMDFRAFLRSVYSLKHAWVTPANRSSGKRPRLVMVLRRRSRVITNEAEAIATATEVGFEVVATGPEMAQEMATFARVVNSCDIIVGVHGAGLTNMMFLPYNGTFLQIIPWGNVEHMCRGFYGVPASAMGLRYVEYKISSEESTLHQVYPKDHAVFTDLDSVHKLGDRHVFEIFLDAQNFTLDIDRFRAAMQQIYQSVTIA